MTRRRALLLGSILFGAGCTSMMGARYGDSADRVEPTPTVATGSAAGAMETPDALILVPGGITGRDRTELVEDLVDRYNRDAEVTDFADAPVLDRAAISEMFFHHYGVNPTIETRQQPVSTFSVDVDTASYTMVRGYLERGALPPEAAVRVEELVNAFDYGYRADPDKTFTVQAEVVPSPTRDGFHLLHLGLATRDVPATQRKDAHLVFVIDVSGSMERENRLGLVKQSLRLLVDQLGAGDRVGIVVYGSRGRVVLESTPATHRERILSAIDLLEPEGVTNVQEGLDLGYAMAARHLSVRSVNRVILCSDGVANAGTETDAAGLYRRIRQEAERGITISTVGFGMGHFNDELMEQLAQKGDGNYSYVDTLAEAERIFVTELTGTLQVLARNAKVQLELDSDRILRYRLIGYENRWLANEDFENDRVDAGEVGAGHSVTALYELQFRDGLAANADSGPGALPFGRVRLRWADPDGGTIRTLERDLPRSIVRERFDDGTAPTRLAAVVAGFGEKLRGSYWARALRYEDLARRVGALEFQGEAGARVAELERLIELARKIDGRPDRFAADEPLERMSFERVPVLR